MANIISGTFLLALAVATMRTATPLILAAMGEVFAERSGVLNLGLEASMLFGAFTGFAVAHYGGSLGLGVLAAVAAGVLTALVMAFFCVVLMADQTVTGMVLTILAVAATSFGFDLIAGMASVSPQTATLPNWRIPVLGDLPVLGPIFFNHNAITYAAFAAALLAGPLLYRTRWGLKVRACGEDGRAAAASGVNVPAVRVQALILNGALAGLAGAALTLGQLGLFVENITSGRGFMAIAAVVFGRWKPSGALIAALFFGLTDALQLRLQALGLGVPHQFLLMLPYALTIVALVLGIGRKLEVGTPAGPRELGVPFERESA